MFNPYMMGMMPGMLPGMPMPNAAPQFQMASRSPSSPFSPILQGPQMPGGQGSGGGGGGGLLGGLLGGGGGGGGGGLGSILGMFGGGGLLGGGASTGASIPLGDMAGIPMAQGLSLAAFL